MAEGWGAARYHRSPLLSETFFNFVEKIRQKTRSPPSVELLLKTSVRSMKHAKLPGLNKKVKTLIF